MAEFDTICEGDIIICKPGFNTDGSCISALSGGTGYKEGEMRPARFKGSSFPTSNPKIVVWEFNGGSGVFLQAH